MLKLDNWMFDFWNFRAWEIRDGMLYQHNIDLKTGVLDVSQGVCIGTVAE